MAKKYITCLYLVACFACQNCNQLSSGNEKRETAIAHVQAIKALVPTPKREPQPFVAKLSNVKASPSGLEGRRLQPSLSGGKYLTYFDSLEAEGATIRIDFANRSHNVSRYWGRYPSGQLVEFPAFGNIAEAEWFQREAKRLAGQFDERTMPVSGKTETNRMAKTPRPPKSLSVDVSIPAGYGPSLSSGFLLVSDGVQEIQLPLRALPKPTETQVDRLRVGNAYKAGHSKVTVSLSRAMGTSMLTTDPSDNPSQYEFEHQQFQYTGCFFSTSTPNDLAPGKTLDLLMRLKRVRWSDRTGPWFILNLRDVLNPKHEVRDEYTLSVDPNSKRAEFEAILVETHAWTETLRIPSVGELQTIANGTLNFNLKPNVFGVTTSGWSLKLDKSVKLEVMDDRHGKATFTGMLTSPTGKNFDIEPDELDPLKDAHFITDIQFTGQSTGKSTQFGEPIASAKGLWKEGPLGDIVVTICHLERHVYAPQLLRLAIQTGGKTKGQEFFRDKVN